MSECSCPHRDAQIVLHQLSMISNRWTNRRKSLIVFLLKAVMAVFHDHRVIESSHCGDLALLFSSIRQTEKNLK